MLRASSSMLRTAARKTALGLAGTTAISCTALTAYAYTDSGAGFRREVQFWRRVAPVVADYYLQTSSSSPLVKYQHWRNGYDKNEDEDDKWKSRRNEVLQQLHKKHSVDILNVMLELRGLYIKLGQVLSVTALPVPEEYREKFRTLQSDVPGWEEFDAVIKPTLEKEFGIKSLEEIFEYVDPVPCGAASIGQAHRAKLKKKNNHYSKKDNDAHEERDVIVKVQYPDAVWQVPADIECVGDFLKICVWAGVVDEQSSKLSFDEFSRQFRAELDYNREKENLKEVYRSSLDPKAPYQKRNVVIPKVYDDYCTDKIITMTYLPGPKLEAEAKRQLAQLGVDTSKGIANVVKEAARDAANPEEPESGEVVHRVSNTLDPKSSAKLERRVTQQLALTPSSETTAAPTQTTTTWKVTISKIIGNIFGVDSILYTLRLAQKIMLWSNAAAVATIQSAPLRNNILVPSSWRDWAEAHATAAAQARNLNLTEKWMDALFDVHGHQVFNLGLFNADPHPGNILVIEEDDKDKIADKNSGSSSSPTSTNRLGLIDYGQCKRLTPKEQVQIARLVLSVANNESDETIAAAFRALGVTTQNDSTEFLAQFSRLMFGPLKTEHLDHGWHVKLHKMDRILYFPKELSMVYRTSLLLRGLAVSLQMNYSVGDMWREHAQEAVDRYDGVGGGVEKI